MPSLNVTITLVSMDIPVVEFAGYVEETVGFVESISKALLLKSYPEVVESFTDTFT